MKSSEIRDLTNDELQQQREDARKELFNLRVQQSMGQLEKATRIRLLKRDIARMETILRERQRAK